MLIEDEFRIRVEGVRGEFDYYRTKHYYHVLCFEAMIDFVEMIPLRKFVCDAGEGWGMIVKKWYQHRGWIDPEVLVQYVKDRETWDTEHYGEFPPAMIQALFASEQRNAEGKVEAIASSPALRPGTAVTSRKEHDFPVLQGYITDECWVSLFLLLQLPEIWAGRTRFIARPFLMLREVEPWLDVYEELEAEEYGPKTEKEVNMEIEQQRRRQDEKRKMLRMVWERWHPPATEVPDSLDLSDGDAETAEGVGEDRKRGRSSSGDGEEIGDKRQRLQSDDDAEGET
jgi:hypothetical protein